MVQGRPDAKIEWFSPRPPLRAIPIARNADPQPPLRKRPLIVVSHGNWGSRYSQGWLALELVKAGYVVLSTSHPGTVGDDQTVAGRYRLWDRSRDVSFALDEVLKNPKWAALIDEDRIGFVGHSFGGWTGVSLAGGRYDPARQRAFCEKRRTKDFYCEDTLKDDIAGVPRGDAGGSFKDGRIKAFYIMGSGPGQGFTADSLKSISRPSWWTRRNSTRSWSRWRIRPTSPGRSRAQGRWCGRSGISPMSRNAAGWSARSSPGLPAFRSATIPRGSIARSVHKQVAPDVVAFFDRALPPSPPSQ